MIPSIVFSVLSVALFLPAVQLAGWEKPKDKGWGKGYGTSTIFRNQDYKGNYDFGYDITDAEGATNFRREAGDAKGNVVGSYGLTDIDGRTRLVEYAADKYGFTAAIKSNEPGVGDEDAADAIYNGVDKNKKSFGYTVEFTDKEDKGWGKPDDKGGWDKGWDKAWSETKAPAEVMDMKSKMKQSKYEAAAASERKYVQYIPSDSFRRHHNQQQQNQEPMASAAETSSSLRKYETRRPSLVTYGRAK